MGEEEVASLEAFGKLISNHSAFDMTLVADVLQQCGNEYSKAYEVLCEMVIPPDIDADHPPNGREKEGGDVHHTKQSSPSQEHQYAHSAPEKCHPEYSSLFEVTSTDENTDSKIRPDKTPSLPTSTSAPVLRGAWAHKSMGRRYRVDEMCRKYEWVARKVVEDLFDKYHDCLELVENDILHMFPIDEPEAYGGGQSNPSTPNLLRGRRKAQASHQRRVSPQQKAMAESLRQQAADEIRRDAQIPETVFLTSKGMHSLREKLWTTRATRMHLQQLANQTRKACHVANAKEKDAELRRLSTHFLERMRGSEEYRNGLIDLHGLTKEESLQLIAWKFEDGGQRRFRVITGKGIHSHNGQAVLRPALEKYFRSNGISYTVHEDAVMSVNT